MSAWANTWGIWNTVKDGDKRALALYERHYSAYQYADGRNRNRFIGPGERAALMTAEADALFVWRKTVYRQDGQTGIECAVFRNESAYLSSFLILAAIELAWQRWPDETRLYTYVSPSKVRSTNPGACFKFAGFQFDGLSSKGLHRLVSLKAVG